MNSKWGTESLLCPGAQQGFYSHHLTYSSEVYEDSKFSTSLSTLTIVSPLKIIFILIQMTWYLTVITICHFPSKEWCWEFFLVHIGHLYIFWWSVFQILCLFLIGVICFFWRRQWHPTLVLLPGKIPRMEEPGRLQSMGSLRVGHDWVTSLSLFTFMHWRRRWQTTPVFLSGESQGQGSLVGCHLRGRTESDITELT